jgi:hypothetical protein
MLERITLLGAQSGKYRQALSDKNNNPGSL